MMKKGVAILTVVAFAAVLALAYRMSQPQEAARAGEPRAEDNFARAEAQKPRADMFTGVVTKQGDEFVLQAGSTTYRLSDQAAAAEHEGKRVRVRGTLDAATNTIQVEKIEPIE
jgi:flagellar basal body-associated protein FliL